MLLVLLCLCVTLLSLTSTLCLLCMLYTLTTWSPPQGHVKVTEVFLPPTSQTLDNADASKTPSDMMSWLCYLMSGRNLDFILAGAASTGKLLGLASKLVKQVTRMWDYHRYRSIIWSNLPDISMSEIRDVIGRGRKRMKRISRGSTLTGHFHFQIC